MVIDLDEMRLLDKFGYGPTSKSTKELHVDVETFQYDKNYSTVMKVIAF